MFFLFGLKETSKIEMIYLNGPSIEVLRDWNGKAFKKMKNLKTLIIKSGHFSKGSRYFPSSLRVLEWQRYPSECIPFSLLNKASEIYSYFPIMYTDKFNLIYSFNFYLYVFNFYLCRSSTIRRS